MLDLLAIVGLLLLLISPIAAYMFDRFGFEASNPDE
jgi:hypothetical protein